MPEILSTQIVQVDDNTKSGAYILKLRVIQLPFGLSDQEFIAPLCVPTEDVDGQIAWAVDPATDHLDVAFTNNHGGVWESAIAEFIASRMAQAIDPVKNRYVAWSSWLCPCCTVAHTPWMRLQDLQQLRQHGAPREAQGFVGQLP